MNIELRPMSLVFNCPTKWGQYTPRLALNPKQVEVSLLLAARQGVKRHQPTKTVVIFILVIIQAAAALAAFAPPSHLL
ncbi:hypothetical protein BADSM9389_38490 [Buttiauxella agrestis]|nr:hypothetical protein BADSM9389_38490 [Buttiauxella agrestis]